MAFSAGELLTIANEALDFYIKGPAIKQATLQRPLFNALSAKSKTFPGGKGNISIPIKGAATPAIVGYAHDDTVTYTTPGSVQRAAYAWKELHEGIKVTLTELKIDGISVEDTDGKKTSEHSDRELTALTNILEDKLDEMVTGWADSFNAMLWKDGTQDAKEVPGLLALITTTPTLGTCGGISRVTNTFWRNRVSLGIVQSAASQTLTKLLRAEARQLSKFGGKPSLVLAGSTFLEALDLEVAEKGTYTQQGFMKSGENEIGMAEVTMRGVGTFKYDPTLDVLGLGKYCYVIDENAVKLRVMDGEDKKTHNPARAFDKYVIYRAMTWTGGLTASQLNSSGVYTIA